VAHIRKANTAGNKRLLQVIIIILVPIVLEVVQSARKAVDSVDATTSIIVADGRERVKLTSRGQPVISGFPVGNELDNKNGNRAEQQDVDKAALVQEELENEPDDEEYCTNHPHVEFLFNGSSKLSERAVCGPICQPLVPTSRRHRKQKSALVLKKYQWNNRRALCARNNNRAAAYWLCIARH